MTTPGAVTLTTIEEARPEVASLPGVESAAVHHGNEHGKSHGDRWMLSIVLSAGYHRVPPRVLSCLADHDLGIADVSPQGDRLIVAAV